MVMLLAGQDSTSSQEVLATSESETDMTSVICSSYRRCAVLYEAVTVLADCVSHMTVAAQKLCKGLSSCAVNIFSTISIHIMNSRIYPNPGLAYLDNPAFSLANVGLYSA